MEEIDIIKNENAELKQKIVELEERLKKYTDNTKKYYENHKEEIKQKVKEYKEKTNYIYVPSPEQKKAWARTAYLNKKAKMKNLEKKEESEII